MVEVLPPSAPEGEPRRSDRPRHHDAPTGSRPRHGAHRKRKKHKKRSFWKELPLLVVVALLLTFLIQQFVARVYMIPSGSMQTTLHGCPGCTPDRVLVDKLVYHFSDPEPGEVVVFRGPGPWTENDAPQAEPDTSIGRFFAEVGAVIGLAPPSERDFVKRIIAVGGQTVACCDEQNRVLVDGLPLDEPYLYWEPGTGGKQQPFAEVEVPRGMVWVMGDNRNNSSDSRVQGGGGARGAIPMDHIIGKARLIVLPASRWGGISDHNPQAVG